MLERGKMALVALGLLLGCAGCSKPGPYMSAAFSDMSDRGFNLRATAPGDSVNAYAFCQAVWFAYNIGAQQFSLTDPVYREPDGPEFGEPVPSGWVALDTIGYLDDEPNPPAIRQCRSPSLSRIAASNGRRIDSPGEWARGRLSPARDIPGYRAHGHGFRRPGVPCTLVRRLTGQLPCEKLGISKGAIQQNNTGRRNPAERAHAERGGGKLVAHLGNFFIRTLAGLALAVAAIAPWQTATAQVPPDVLVVGQIAEPKSMDPHTVTAVNDFRILVNVYDGLVRYQSGTLEVAPGLAESWVISADGLTYTFKLRDGVRFHDGTPFNAEAVKFNFDRMLVDDHPYHDTGPFPLSFFFGSIASTEMVDDLTVRFTLSEPYAPFLSNLAYPTGLIVSPTAVRQHGQEFGRNPSGTGPFIFSIWESNRQVALERNANYWDGVPDLRGVVFRPITDANARVSEMLSGGIDLMVEVPPDNVALFDEDADFRLHEQAGPHLWFLILNLREPPFDDVRMRQAINYAIDKQSLVDDVLQGTATVATGPTPAAFSWAYNETLQPYPHDPAKARELIEAAGHGGGVEITFYVTEGGSGMLDPIPMGTAIQADLAEVGIDAKIETYEWNTFLGRVNPGLEGKADMAEMAWMTNDPDTLPFLALRTAAMPEQGGFNSGYYSNPEVDALLEAARRSTDQAERARLYRDMQQIVYDDAPWAFIASWKQNAVTTAAVTNFQLEPSFLLLLQDVSKN